ncbi:bifunctional molybdenum cofactor biosynthesis protein MoaC/MoaB [Lysobacter pythonis]|uniref:Bifunctional molybdenum cofactor biosynthesis protein MoaC/MoaB n=1 Tax=Solilutibacter pythonis TaxID=2483112 RepID=A0A3M2I2G6_9GAMM|nr:bifunctional molybdenum cofactor biosynthesis protein MoaC/MoaB [Lysobacter pythonis]RMH93789.1 bifunctional molybdenum cofactor biosynthesis protein MoaC/MoaB [Lysobacter pythonis]
MKEKIDSPPGGFHMADVRRKRATERRAVAVGELRAGDAFALVVEKRLPKGDAMTMAEVAGLQGAKQASALMPLCHPLLLEYVDVRCVPVAERQAIRVYCEVATLARTGVEMEALAGVNAALLTLYDLTKPVKPDLTIDDVHLLFKEGGKKGLWICPQSLTEEETRHYRPRKEPRLDDVSAHVVTLSDRAHAGIYADEAGPLAVARLTALGARVGQHLLPDDRGALGALLSRLSDEGTQLVVCTGGTGLGARDLTPEALVDVATRRVPGLAELFRSASAAHTSLAWLSRAEAVLLGDMLVIALPGSPRAVKQGMDILAPLLAHAIAMVRGEPHP